MIFVLAKNHPKLFLMLTEQDVNNMRGGRTTFVDEHQLNGTSFTGVILSLHESNGAAVEVLKRAGHKMPANMVTPEPVTPKEGRCTGCQGIMEESILFEGKCIVCWCESARHYQLLCKEQEEEL